MKAQKPKCKSQNARKWRPTRPKWKEMKAQKAKNWKMEPAPALLESLYRRLGKRTIFGNLWGEGPQKLTPKEPKCKEVKAHKAKMKGNEGPQGQNARKSRSTRLKWKEIKAQKAKIKGNESPKAKMQKPKCKEMKAHKAKMKGNEGPKGQKLENGAGPGAAKFFVWEIGKTDHFWQLVGGAHELASKTAKMQGNQGPQGQNERKWRPTRPKWKEMKAHKAKMQGNQGPQGQNERKWRPTRPKIGKWSRSRRC